MGQLDWLRYWNGTTADKTDVYFFPKLLREKVATLHFPVLGSALTALTQEHSFSGSRLNSTVSSA